MSTPEMGHPLLDGFYLALGEEDDGSFRVSSFCRVGRGTYRVVEYSATAERDALPPVVTESVWPRVVAAGSSVRIVEPPAVSDVLLDDRDLDPTVLERFAEYIIEDLYPAWREHCAGCRPLDAFIDR